MITKGLKTYRHKDNSKEKELHDKFLKQFDVKGVSQIVNETYSNGEPKKYVSNDEYRLIITTIQWLGSPVGQAFLKECGFELKTN